jgi:hypothetical protein
MVLINSRDGRGRPCQLLESPVRSLARVTRLLPCCVLRRSLHYLISRNQNEPPARTLPARFATTAQRSWQLMARRDQIFPRDVRAVDLNLISRPAPFDDTPLPVIFSYRRMCIWDARSSLGDVSQSAERARKRCGAREARVDRFGVAGPRETLCNYRAW